MAELCELVFWQVTDNSGRSNVCCVEVLTDGSRLILLKNTLSHSRSAFIKVGIWEMCLRRGLHPGLDARFCC